MVDIYGTIGNDNLYGTSFSDRMFGDNGNDSIAGNGSGDFIYGGNGNDYLIGNGGNDYLSGDSGNDTLNGYGARIEYDTLVGGSGFDTFVLGARIGGVFYQGNGYATIQDWDYVSDYIQVRGSASQYRLIFGNWTGTSARDTAIYYGNDVIGLVQDRTNVSLSRDFIFV